MNKIPQTISCILLNIPSSIISSGLMHVQHQTTPKVNIILIQSSSPKYIYHQLFSGSKEKCLHFYFPLTLQITFQCSYWQGQVYKWCFRFLKYHIGKGVGSRTMDIGSSFHLHFCSGSSFIQVYCTDTLKWECHFLFFQALDTRFWKPTWRLAVIWIVSVRPMIWSPYVALMGLPTSLHAMLAAPVSTTRTQILMKIWR